MQCQVINCLDERFPRKLQEASIFQTVTFGNPITAQMNSKLDWHRMFMGVQSGFTRWLVLVAGPKSLSTVPTTKYE